MNVEVKPILITTDVRKSISEGIEQEITTLHKPEPWYYAIYLFYPLLAVAGIVVEFSAYRQGLGWNLAFVQYAVGVLCVALAINAMFLLVHEAVHGVLFANLSLNRWVAVVIGGAGFVSFSAYRVLHLRHHEYLGDERDPDDYQNYTNNQILVWLLHYNRLLWATLLYLVFVPILSFRYGDRTDRINVVTEYLLIGVAYTTIFLIVPLKLIIVAWLIPFCLANLMINIRGLTQHGITDASDPFIASRTIETNAFVRFLLLNENFHLEHHLFPGVPSYNLTNLHDLLRDRLPRRVSCSSYSSFLFQFIKASLHQNTSPIGLKIYPELK